MTVARSLAGQSVLIAVVCLVTDVVSFVVRGPATLGPRELLVLGALVLADIALASAPRYSGWVAVAHAALLPVLTLVLPAERSASTAGQLVAGYRAGAWLRGWPAVGALAALALGVLASLVVGGVTDAVGAATVVTANAALPWLVGRYTTARKAYVDELRRHAQDEVDRAVARAREAIAHDLHDVISHHVGAVGVHATAARLNLAAPAAEPVITSLAAVEASSRAAMVDLRRLLDLLHGGDGTVGRPGLGKLAELVEGVGGTFVVYDELHPVPPAVDLTLYRVTQEMLTNALRHGEGSAVRVELEYGGDHVTVTARNRIAAGAAASDQGSGRGLDGIGKRVAELGGRAASGPVGDGRYWETSVTVPIGEGR